MLRGQKPLIFQLQLKCNLIIVGPRVETYLICPSSQHFASSGGKKDERFAASRPDQNFRHKQEIKVSSPTGDYQDSRAMKPPHICADLTRTTPHKHTHTRTHTYGHVHKLTRILRVECWE